MKKYENKITGIFKLLIWSEPRVWSLRTCGLVEFEKKKVGLTML